MKRFKRIVEKNTTSSSAVCSFRQVQVPKRFLFVLSDVPRSPGGEGRGAGEGPGFYPSTDIASHMKLHNPVVSSARSATFIPQQVIMMPRDPQASTRLLIRTRGRVFMVIKS